VRRDCQAREATRELPALESSPSLPESGNLAVSQALTIEVLESELASSLEGQLSSGEKVTRVAVRPERIDDQDVLFLGLTVDGATCGTAWFRAVPVAVSADELRLREVVPLAEQSSALSDTLRAHIERNAAMKSEFSFGEVRNQLENLVSSLTQGLTGEVVFELALGPPTPLEPDVTASGLELWTSIELSARARLQ
jgi:hypothetical protein